MHFTIVIGGLSGGGAERVVCNLSNYLINKHSITIITMTEDEPAYILDTKVKRISLIKKDNTDNVLKKNIKRIREFRRYIKEVKTDRYIVFLPKTIQFVLAHRHLIKVPIIISERGDPTVSYKKSFLQKIFMRYMVPKADNFVFQTYESKKFYEKFIGNRGTVIPNAINEEFIRPLYMGQREKKIVAIGRFTEQKNFEMLIDAFYNIHRDFPEYVLEIYGDGPLREKLKSKILSYNIENKVNLPGYVENIINHIEYASLFILSSNYEGMPNALMEAMALGIPVISTNCPVGGPKFLIESGENGILIPVGDTVELTNKIKLMLSDKKLSEKISGNSRGIIDMLNPHIIYNKWEQLICSTNLN